MPISTARASSLLAANATRCTARARSPAGTLMSCWGVSWGNAGKSSAGSMERVNDEFRHPTCACASLVFTWTAASCRLFTISEKSFPGTTARPGSITSARAVWLMDVSKSVVWNVTMSSFASTSTPESIGSVAREDMPLPTTFKAF